MAPAGSHLTIGLDKVAIRTVADVVASLGLAREAYEGDLFPVEGPEERVLGFFTSMVAVDHRTRTPLTSFEAVVDGRRLEGSDLLYWIAARIYELDEASFTLDWLVNLAPSQALKFLCYEDTCVWDLFTRIYLLRDLGKKVARWGSFREMLDAPTVGIFLARLSEARAYEDPVRKKAFLLAKFLDGRGLISFDDPENLHVPVDNHLSRIAVRLGIVRPDDQLMRRIREGDELSREEDVEIRMIIREAWKEVSELSGVDPFTLDDFLWPLGRTTCTELAPSCDRCPLTSACFARSKGEYPREHTHVITWYY